MLPKPPQRPKPKHRAGRGLKRRRGGDSGDDGDLQPRPRAGGEVLPPGTGTGAKRDSNRSGRFPPTPPVPRGRLPPPPSHRRPPRGGHGRGAAVLEGDLGLSEPRLRSPRGHHNPLSSGITARGRRHGAGGGDAVPPPTPPSPFPVLPKGFKADLRPPTGRVPPPPTEAGPPSAPRMGKLRQRGNPAWETNSQARSPSEGGRSHIRAGASPFPCFFFARIPAAAEQRWGDAVGLGSRRPSQTHAPPPGSRPTSLGARSLLPHSDPRDPRASRPAGTRSPPQPQGDPRHWEARDPQTSAPLGPTVPRPRRDPWFLPHGTLAPL